jgi:LCP family protein required for cell wall assembly
MFIKKLLIFVFAIALTTGLVISGVMALRLKQATQNPVSVFFGDDIEITEIEDKSLQKSKFVEVDLVRDQKSYIKKPNVVSIAVLGRDATPVEERRSDGGNTDIMIVMVVDLDNTDVKAISIPRDTVAHIDHYQSKEVQDEEFFDKINSAYSAGGSINGREFQLKNSVACIQEYLNTFGTFDIKVDNYVEIGLTGLRELTDDVDGVEVVMNNGIPGVGAKGQTVKLNGKTAMLYVRDRYNSGGDIGRVSNAQTFVKALAKKLQSLGVKEVVPKLVGSMVSGNLMRTDLTLEEIAALASLLEDINVDGLQMQTVDSINADDIGDIKKHLDLYPYDYEAFYGASTWNKLAVKKGDEYDVGMFSDYYSLEEIILNTYYSDAGAE